MAKRLGLLLGILALGAGCDFEPVCTPLVYNRATELCECPMGAPYDPDSGGCVLPDGGVIPVDGGGDAGRPATDACTPVPETCNGLDDDCDGSSDEAAAAAACEAVPGATRRTCTAGECVVLECASGRDDCNGEYADGCEAELATDDAHCGGCGLACDAGESCEASACVELPNVEWVTALAVGATSSYVSDHAVAGDGSTCVIGHFSGEFRFGARTYRATGSTAVFVARVGRSGGVEWYGVIDGPGADSAFAVVAGESGQCTASAGPSAGAVVVGTREVTLASRANLIARFTGANTAAQIVWVGSLQLAEMISEGASVVAAGRASEAFDLDGVNVPTEGLLRFDAVSLRLLGAAAVPAATVTIEEDGDVYAAGALFGTTTVAGTAFSPGEPDGDVLVSRWSRDLALVEGWVVGRSSWDLAFDIESAGSGHVYVAGASYLDDGNASESVIWTITPGEDPELFAVATGVRSVADLVVRDGIVMGSGAFGTASRVGEIDLASSGGDDVFSAIWTPDLEVLWARSFGTVGDDWLTARAGYGESIVLAGYVGATFDIPEGRVEIAGDRAALVMSARVE